MNDSWSSEETARPEPQTDDAVPEQAPARRRSERHDAPAADEPRDRGERHPWVGLAFLLVGLGAGGVGLATIAMELDQPGMSDVPPERWWLVVGGGLAIAWSAPWFLRPRGRARMAVALGVCTAAILAVSAIAIGGLSG